VLALPKLQVDQDVTVEEAQRALSDALGDDYQVRVNGSALKVKRNTMSAATVRVSSSGGTTTFRVSGDGFTLRKLMNSLGIASKVGKALGDAFATGS
jgi:hypothetical protein